MNQLKRAQIVMLPHNNTNTKITLYKDNDGEPLELSLNLDKLAFHTNQHLYIISDDKIKENDFILTFTYAYGYTVDQIKEVHKGIYVSVRNQLLPEELIKGKIIATTDTSLFIEQLNQCDGCKANIPLSDNIHREGRELGMACSKHKYRDYLPQPSQQFITKYIEEYNKGNIITDVLVEYDSYTPGIDDSGYGFAIGKEIETIKVNSKDNTITIKKLKGSWNRSEIEEKLFEALTADGPGAFNMGWESKDARDWIDKNL